MPSTSEEPYANYWPAMALIQRILRYDPLGVFVLHRFGESLPDRRIGSPSNVHDLAASCVSSNPPTLPDAGGVLPGSLALGGCGVSVARSR